MNFTTQIRLFRDEAQIIINRTGKKFLRGPLNTDFHQIAGFVVGKIMYLIDIIV